MGTFLKLVSDKKQLTGWLTEENLVRTAAGLFSGLRAYHAVRQDACSSDKRERQGRARAKRTGHVVTCACTIADPPIMSSSPRNGSGTAMNADLSLVEQSDSSACPARSLQNVPVRPPIAQSTPSFF